MVISMMENSSIKSPRFAVIGRVNEGKSSVVSTLTENDRIAVGPDPGTTQISERFDVRGDGYDLFSLIDTPGFEEPERVLAWLRQRADTAAERRAAIHEFVRTFSGSGDFSAECQLLKPIIDGAAVIYVVSSKHPFRPGFEVEMEILRWTGAPRLALINKSDGVDYSIDWKSALSQYFNIVKEFDAMRGGFVERMHLLEALRVMNDDAASALDHAMQVLSRIQLRRLQRSVDLMARLVEGMLSFRMKLSESEAADPNKNVVIDRFHDHLRALEINARAEIEQLFNFSRIERKENEFSKPIYEKDLFAEETWQFLGQPRWVLITLGTLAGGALGGAVDIKTAGFSGFLATPIGMLLGAASALGATAGEPEAKIKGANLAGRVVAIGPHKDPNFSWVILDRALLHFRALLTRTHAVREAMLVDGKEKIGLVHGLESANMLAIGKVMGKIKKSDSPEKYRDQLIAALKPVIWELAKKNGSLHKS